MLRSRSIFSSVSDWAAKMRCDKTYHPYTHTDMRMSSNHAPYMILAEAAGTFESRDRLTCKPTQADSKC